MTHTAAIVSGVFWSTLLSGLHPACAAPGDTVWQWADAHGQTHFSDSRPVEDALPGRQISFERQSPGAAGGLRPGERDALQRMERQRTRRQRHALAARQRNDHATATRRTACRATRDKLRGTRDREQRKHYSGYLRKNCW
jgi:hypothetical protein